MGKDILIGKIDDDNADVRKTAQEMDVIRQRTIAYEYLCRLEEAKLWMEACLREELPAAVEFEENLRNGVYLAKLGNFIAPDLLPLTKIYDIDQRRYKMMGLQFKHTDNINKFLQILKKTELPVTFQPETTDIYDNKNMPKVIYCLHALSSHLFKLGKAPLIHDVFGKAVFTDEQLDSVSKDLQKCKHPLPMFHKISGILSNNNNTNDNVSVQNALIELNNLLDSEKSITCALLNPNLKIKYIQNYLIDQYKEVLKAAKREKTEVAHNHSLNGSYSPDDYDELLTLVEIQGHITATNYKHLWKTLCAACRSNDINKLHKIFTEEWVKIKNYNSGNIDFYCDVVQNIIESCKDVDVESITNWHKIFQNIINDGNIKSKEHSEHKEAIVQVNKALDEGTPDDLYDALTSPKLGLSFKIEKYAAPLLFEEMRLEKCELDKNLNESEIAATALYLNDVAAVSEAVERGNEIAVWNALNSKQINLEGLRPHCRRRYLSALISALQVKVKEQCECPLLTLEDIKDTLDMVNVKDDNNDELIEIIDQINKAVTDENSEALITLLKSSCLKLPSTLHREEYPLYMRTLKKRLLQKELENLWLEDIIGAIDDVNTESKKVKELTEEIIQLNLAIVKNDVNDFWKALKSQQLSCSEMIESSCKEVYFQMFSKALKKKGHHICPWIVCHTEASNTVYIDVESYTYSWSTPKDFVPYSRYLSKKDVKAIVDKTNKHHINSYRYRELEKTMTRFQAHCKGFLIRKSVTRLLFFKDNVDSIIKIQSWWRQIVVNRKYGTLLKMKAIEAKLLRERKRNPWAWYKVQEQKIIKIQALWRGRRARNAFISLFHSPNPPLRVLKKFIPVLDFTTEDYDREMELQTLKSDVVQSIRKNQELSKQIDDMDLKIGLLVQNRIALQEVAAHGLKLNNILHHQSKVMQADGRGTMLAVNTAVKGLKSLTKESKRLLDGYQHLFYELQTNPTYLSKLLFCIPQNKTNSFLQNVVLSLYNFGAYARDEYLLLKLFRFTLEEEISCKVMKPFDIIASTPLVLKMAVSLSRQLSGLNSLQTVIGPLVEKIINDKDLNIETGPVEIYKAWRNETEMKTGQISKLPYIVSQDEALNYPEVKTRLDKALTQLKTVVTMFLEKITNSMELLPFCITYMARVLHRSLTTKFPHTPEKDILKVIGNLVYYQFLNAAIVAPDAFHIINLPIGGSLTTDQRKNLASVAKILHFSAAKKGFGEESNHLRCLNPFIVECHERMKELFRRCCRGPTLEEYFAVDEYTEATLLHHPHIYITVQEIVDTHALLVEYQDVIAEPQDRLNELLDELGDVPSVTQLAARDVPAQVGDTEENARLEVCLALVNKFQAPADDMTDLNKLFIKTKELCVAVIPFLNGEHLLEALCIGTTTEQQEQYSEKVKRRIYSGQVRPDDALTLREHIAKLRRNLEMLEDEGYVTREDGYQALITSIALDLCNKGKYRQAQRRALSTLTRTKQSLLEKTKYYEEKCKSYDQYIKSCLDNLHTGKRSVHACLRRPGKDVQKLKSKLTIKYSATKLLEKGVLLEIDGLSMSQCKNVQFEITPTDHNGVFTITGKFMGVEMETIDVDIQDLLQKQYEGCTIMDMFGKAKINVNLLMFLLNSKFYGKS
ncbi:ras GTPase-activating protein IQGAP1 [Danaus plexippus plexippus]|uniref:Ras GTPase-activating protein IQGAP1 n=1 Tax=Danaus plexippus plexippus TaxID=278856 RepID=A0A212ET63_DANPL|nr:ras GTPase-activating-like protein IQGAP1 [Danaus plexippus plexippus]OWR44686.1 ras GTPase-activating protein IQGAP1 [Danaus plexippus plexippus]